MARLYEPLDHVVMIKLAAGNELVEAEACTVQRVVAPSGTCIGERSSLTIERDGAVGCGPPSGGGCLRSPAPRSPVPAACVQG